MRALVRTCSYFSHLPFQLSPPSIPTSLILPQKEKKVGNFTKAALSPKGLYCHAFQTKFA